MDFSTENKSLPTDFLTDELDGELCYVQTSDGKIVSIHFGLADDYEGVNIKRSIASTFQANFDNNTADVEETDVGSAHTSHYRCVCVCVCVCVCLYVMQKYFHQICWHNEMDNRLGCHTIMNMLGKMLTLNRSILSNKAV